MEELLRARASAFVRWRSYFVREPARSCDGEATSCESQRVRAMAMLLRARASAVVRLRGYFVREPARSCDGGATSCESQRVRAMERLLRARASAFVRCHHKKMTLSSIKSGDKVILYKYASYFTSSVTIKSGSVD